MRLFAAVLMFLTLLVPAAQAERRVALVIGNGAYQAVPALANPRADAEAMAAALERVGFEVELGVDLDLPGMRQTVQAFSRKLEGADVALFFYAGHGLQVYGQNYLLPVDAALETEADLDFSAVPARLVLGQMERWPGVKIVMLDACRDNPFATALSRSMGSNRATRALSRGLAPIETAGGTLLAYATDPGDVAADGEGRHSPFTEALLRHVEVPGVEINTMLARVRAEVYAATGQRQRPWTETSLIGEFYMVPEAPEPPPVQQAMMAPQQPAPPPALPGMDPRQIELALWEAAQAGGTVEDYEEYLRQYPEGIFARIARNRIAALESEAATVSGGAASDQATGATKGVGAENGAAAEVEEDGASGPATALVPDGPEATDSAAAEPDAALGGGSADDTASAGDTDIATAPPPQEVTGVPATDPAAVEAALGLGPAERQEVQARLLVAGHDPRGVDGIFGPGTRAALTSWQAAAGLDATGYLDAATLERLARGTDADYAAYLERQRRDAEARRAAAERARTTRERAKTEAALRAAREAAEAEAAAAALRSAPSPSPSASQQSAPAPAPVEDTRSPRERHEQECYFVFTGSPTLERRCK